MRAYFLSSSPHVTSGPLRALGTDLFRAMVQVKMIHVPFKGGAPAMLSLLQGETFVMIANFLTALLPARANRVKALGVTSLKRTSLARASHG